MTDLSDCGRTCDGWQHINLTGDYLWDADSHLAPDGFRQLRFSAAMTPHAA
jgi:hypothetical protein